MLQERSECRHDELSPEQNAVIDRYQEPLPDAPVAVYELAREFGCQLTELPMQWDVSGAIHRQEDGKFHIYINSGDSPARRRFTCAHELAHFLLHSDHLSDQHQENTMYRSNLSNDKEISANKLAADILMPYDKLNATAETRKYGVEELAQIFGVSRQALLVRLGIPEHPSMVR